MRRFLDLGVYGVASRGRLTPLAELAMRPKAIPKGVRVKLCEELDALAERCRKIAESIRPA